MYCFIGEHCKHCMNLATVKLNDRKRIMYICRETAYNLIKPEDELPRFNSPDCIYYEDTRNLTPKEYKRKYDESEEF